ncbi:MAG: putative cytokinetic ring protein SteA [Bacillota bacterium]|nr:putative cytokinetic ring protein SteA [Bacillota bacterium]MDW7684056.1 putative cytokinetic ring protein SteA [Bacillota bacterium]
MLQLLRNNRPVKIFGPAKKGKKTKLLTERLQAGDIAVIDHRDLDEVSAESLCNLKVKAVINLDSSISGRYPNNGPAKLAEAKIYHLDQAGRELFEVIEDGETLAICDDGIWRKDKLLGRGRLVDDELVSRQLALAEKNLDQLLDSFVQNTLDYARKEKGLILGELDFPSLATDFKDRHALVVVRGQSYRDDLQAIKHYIDEVRPVLVGVDGGADALLEFGYTPDVVVGDMDSVSDYALSRAKERVVHAYTDGRAPGLKRIEELGLTAKIMKAPGTSEDIALLLAYEKKARLIAAIGTHSNMIDFLEKGRKGMASTFLVRLKVGSRLVDARGVSQLYRSRVSGRSLVLVALAACIPVVVLAFANPTIRHLFRLIYMRLRLGL